MREGKGAGGALLPNKGHRGPCAFRSFCYFKKILGTTISNKTNYVSDI